MKHIIKNILLWIPMFRIGNIFLYAYYALKLKKEIKGNFSLKRRHSRRYNLYTRILNEEPFNYFEFGVFSGNSMIWWSHNHKDIDNRFYGFDTFEGLPEDWGKYKKGDMNSKIPDTTDERVTYIKGLFKDTVYDFIIYFYQTKRTHYQNIFHFDADLYSSTIQVLFWIYPILKEGDILIFDEFNVPLHEWRAFYEWSTALDIEWVIMDQENYYLQVEIKILKV